MSFRNQAKGVLLVGGLWFMRVFYNTRTSYVINQNATITGSALKK